MTMAQTIDEEDLRPLVSNGTTNGSSSTKKITTKDGFVLRRYHVLWCFFPFVLVVSLLVFGNRITSLKEEDVQKKPVDCFAYCTMSHTSELLKEATRQRDLLVEQLKIHYGEEYYPLFFLDEKGESIGKSGFRGAHPDKDTSRKRYRRKFMMKILSAQVAATSSKAKCKCNGNKARHLEESNDGDDAEQDTNKKNPQEKVTANNNELPPSSYGATTEDATVGFPVFEKMVFVNGGHSSAAGHGNLLNQTYTAVMEQSAKAVFRSVGIDLIGRNHAMGGMSSGPELALCSESVYGMNADIITWNFGMTDGNEFWRHTLYGNRRGVHRNRPLLLDIDLGENYMIENRRKALQELETAGLASMYMDVSYFYDQHSKDFIPDMQIMKTQAEIDAVPEFLRYFKCGEGLEKGDPLCGDLKYTDECPPYKAPWHPGWKANALNGNILAIFMIDVLLEALQELEATHGSDYQSMLDMLQGQEDADYERFFNSPLPEQEFVKNLWNDTIITTQDYAPLFRKPVLCHTALLPAQIRYRGILTESTDTSSFEQHDIGMDRKTADKRNATDMSEMQLVYNEKVNCPILAAAIDYKDYFFTTYESGETTLTFPNQAERDAYMADGHDILGLIVVCFVKCDWGRCPEGNFNHDQVNGGNATLTVNGVRVEQMVKISECSLLKNEQGYIWKENDEDEYKLTAKILIPGGYMRITSVMLI